MLVDDVTEPCNLSEERTIAVVSYAVLFSNTVGLPLRNMKNVKYLLLPYSYH